MKIYTKTGDAGTTGLLSGRRVPKHHIRIESYGATDELNSWIGLLRDKLVSHNQVTTLIEVQDRLFTIGSHLAMEPGKANFPIPTLSDGDVAFLEEQIDQMNDALPPLRSFVLPGGHETVSQVHIARCVCRRAERWVTQLAEAEAVDTLILKYLNRLSDYLFVLSRLTAKDLNATETPWKPRI